MKILNWKFEIWGFENLAFESEFFILNPLQEFSFLFFFFFFLVWKPIWPVSFHDDYFLEGKEEKEKEFFFFFGVDWVNSIWPSWLSNLAELKCGGRILAPHFPYLLFSFLLSPSSTFLPPLTLFILFFHLIFLFHLTISSPKKNTFLSFSTSLYSSPSIFFRSLCSCALLLHTHFWWNPLSNPSFLCTKMSSSSNGPSFLTSHGKKYHPSFEWNDEEGLFQDPKSYAPHSHMDFKLSFSLISLFGEMLFHVSLKVWWWDIVILLCVLVEIWCIVWLIML